MRTKVARSGGDTHRREALQLRITLALAFTLSACAVSPNGGSNGGSGGGSYRVLTEEAIQGASEINVHDVIRRLRPQWLRPRGRTTLAGQGPDQPVVYVDGARYGNSLADLQRMDPSQVVRIEWVEPINATTRFGTGHSAGAIMVELGSAR